MKSFVANALVWTSSEVDNIISQANSLLKSVVEDNSESYLKEDLLEMQKTYANLANTFKALSLNSCFLIANEISDSFEHMANSNSQSKSEFADIINNIIHASLIIPNIVEYLGRGNKDTPQIILPLVNKIRSLRQAKALGGLSAFFPDILPDIKSNDLPSSIYDENVGLNELKSASSHITSHQIKDLSNDSLSSFSDICLHIAILAPQSTQDSPSYARSLFLLASATLKDMSLGSNAQSSHPFPLFPFMEKLKDELNLLFSHGFDVFGPRNKLHKNSISKKLSTTFLYWIYSSKEKFPHVLNKINQSDISLLVENIYSLDEMRLDVEDVKLSAKAIKGYNIKLASDLSSAINDEIHSLKDSLDLYIRTKDMDHIQDKADVLLNISHILIAAGSKSLGQQMLVQKDNLHSIITSQDSDEEKSNQLFDLASQLLYLDAKIDEDFSFGDMFNGVSRKELFDNISNEINLVVKEIKNSIFDIHSGEKEYDHLPNIKDMVHEIYGVFSMSHLEDASNLCLEIEKCINDAMSSSYKFKNEDMESFASVFSYLEHYNQAHLDKNPNLSNIVLMANTSLLPIKLNIEKYLDENKSDIGDAGENKASSKDSLAIENDNTSNEEKILGEKELADNARKELAQVLEEGFGKTEDGHEKEMEGNRLEEERLAKEEAEHIALQEAEEQRLEEERLAQEAKEEAEHIALQEAEEQRLEEERLAQEAKEEAERIALQEAEEQRLEEERLAKEEAERIALQEVEEQRLEEERLAKEEAERIALQEAERQRLEEERLAKEEAERIALQEAEEQRLEEERLAKEEAERIALQEVEEKRLEEERLAKEAKEEAERIALQEAEEQRLEEERLAKEEAERIALQEAEEQRLEEERLAKEEAERIALQEAEEQRLEEERLAKEAKEEAERIALQEVEEKRLEEERLAKEAKEEAERIALQEAEEQRLEEERLAKEEAERIALQEVEEKRLEEERLAKEAKEEAERIALQEAEEKRLEEERLAKEEAERIALQESLAQEERERIALQEEERLEFERIAKEKEQEKIIDEGIDSNDKIKKSWDLSSLLSSIASSSDSEISHASSKSIKVISSSPTALAILAFDGEPSVEIDGDLHEIFSEEVKEEIASLDEWFELLQPYNTDLDVLKNIRKSFHTIKGSGRMVGAKTLAEMAWKTESILNKVLDNELELSSDVVALTKIMHQSLIRFEQSIVKKDEEVFWDPKVFFEWAENILIEKPNPKPVFPVLPEEINKQGEYATETNFDALLEVEVEGESQDIDDNEDTDNPEYNEHSLVNDLFDEKTDEQDDDDEIANEQVVENVSLDGNDSNQIESIYKDLKENEEKSFDFDGLNNENEDGIEVESPAFALEDDNDEEILSVIEEDDGLDENEETDEIDFISSLEFSSDDKDDATSGAEDISDNVITDVLTQHQENEAEHYADTTDTDDKVSAKKLLFDIPWPTLSDNYNSQSDNQLVHLHRLYEIQAKMMESLDVWEEIVSSFDVSSSQNLEFLKKIKNLSSSQVIALDALKKATADSPSPLPPSPLAQQQPRGSGGRPQAHPGNPPAHTPPRRGLLQKGPRIKKKRWWLLWLG